MIYDMTRETFYTFLRLTPFVITSMKWAKYRRLHANDFAIYQDLYTHLQKQTKHYLNGKKRVYELEALESKIINDAFEVGISQPHIKGMLKMLTS